MAWLGGGHHSGKYTSVLDLGGFQFFLLRTSYDFGQSPTLTDSQFLHL